VGGVPHLNGAIPLTGDPAADDLLAEEPLALLIGMLLNQQTPMERAFYGPYELKQRLGGRLDVGEIAAADPAALAAAFAEAPALHRAAGAMAARTQELCRTVVDDYGGDPAAVWSTARSGQELFDHLCALPGFGAHKARVLMILLSDHLGVAPAGAADITGPYRDREFFSIAPAPKKLVDGRWTR